MTGDPSRRWSHLAVFAAVLLQLGVLYAPTSVGPTLFPNIDKLVHCAVFALPVFLALRARLPLMPVVAVVAAHAPVSELIQWTLLPNRSGDPWDVVADLVGVALGAGAAHLALRAVPREN